MSKSETTNLAIEAQGLVKRFGDKYAVNGVDLNVRKGTIYGFLGPNGAGKTTTIRMLATLLRPDEGTATIFGHDLISDTAAVKRSISLTGQYASIDDDLTGFENVTMIARLNGYSRKQAKERAIDLLHAFGLSEAAPKQVKKYSGGMRRRLDIAASIVVTPDLLFLDEPTTGLDPRSRNQVWDIVRTLVQTGTTVLLTTQYLEEADQLADRIGVMKEGKIIAEGTSEELKASIKKNTFSIEVADKNDIDIAERILQETLPVPIQKNVDHCLLTAQVHETTSVVEALGRLTKNNIEINDFSMSKPSLDEVFLALTDSTDQGRPGESKR
jgi:ABC-2 type transport system ATP-binding protein